MIEVAGKDYEAGHSKSVVLNSDDFAEEEGEAQERR